MNKIETERELIKQVIAGQVQKFETLVKNYNSFLYKLGLVYLYNKDEIDDVIQSSFLLAFEKLSSFRGDSSFKSWISKIMINECKQANRKLLLHRKAQNLLREFVRPQFESIDVSIIQLETKTQLEEAIAKLSSIYKSVLTYRLIMGTSTRDTAISLGISEDTVKIRLLRAKKQVRAVLSRSDFRPEELRNTINYYSS